MGASELRAVYRGKDLYILASVGAWIKTKDGEISFLGIGPCHRLSPEDEAALRQQLSTEEECNGIERSGL